MAVFFLVFVVRGERQCGESVYLFLWDAVRFLPLTFFLFSLRQVVVCRAFFLYTFFTPSRPAIEFSPGEIMGRIHPISLLDSNLVPALGAMFSFSFFFAPWSDCQPIDVALASLTTLKMGSAGPLVGATPSSRSGLLFLQVKEPLIFPPHPADQRGRFI